MGFFKALGNEIVTNIKTKRYGFYVAVAAWVFTFMFVCTYAAVTEDIYNPAVIGYAVAGIVLFAVLSLFRQTSQIATVLLMVFDFMCFIGFAQAGGLIDYFTTQFFDGFSLGKFFALPTANWFCIILMVLSIICSAVAMYMPQNKKKEKAIADAPADTDNAVSDLQFEQSAASDESTDSERSVSSQSVAEAVENGELAVESVQAGSAQPLPDKAPSSTRKRQNKEQK